jgi:hypothetical protein
MCRAKGPVTDFAAQEPSGSTAEQSRSPERCPGQEEARSKAELPTGSQYAARMSRLAYAVAGRTFSRIEMNERR